MIVELGHYALVLAFGLALVQGTLPLWGAARRDASLIALAPSAAIVQFLKPMVISLAFGVLICMPATLILTPAFYMIGIDIKRVIVGLFGFYGRLYGGRRKLAAAE